MASSSASLMGSESSLSLHGAESHIISLVIFIFTGVAANVLVLSGSEVDTFLILLLVLFLWIIIRNAMLSVADATRLSTAHRSSTIYSSTEDEGWLQAWETAMDFVSRILVLLTFQVAGNLILQEWLLAGVTTQETLVLLFLIAIIFFPVFLWIHRSWEAHTRREKEELQRYLRAWRLRSSAQTEVSAAALLGRRLRHYYY